MASRQLPVKYAKLPAILISQIESIIWCIPPPQLVGHIYVQGMFILIIAVRVAVFCVFVHTSLIQFRSKPICSLL